MMTAERNTSTAERIMPSAERNIATAERFIPSAIRFIPSAERFIASAFRFRPSVERFMASAFRFRPSAESNTATSKRNWQSLCAQVSRKTEVVTTVNSNGSFRFSVAGKSKAGNLHIFTPKR